MDMCVLPVCMSVNHSANTCSTHLHAWRPPRAFPATGITDGLSGHVGAKNRAYII